MRHDGFLAALWMAIRTADFNQLPGFRASPAVPDGFPLREGTRISAVLLLLLQRVHVSSVKSKMTSLRSLASTHCKGERANWPGWTLAPTRDTTTRYLIHFGISRPMAHALPLADANLTADISAFWIWKGTKRTK